MADKKTTPKDSGKDAGDDKPLTAPEVPPSQKLSDEDQRRIDAEMSIEPTEEPDPGIVDTADGSDEQLAAPSKSSRLRRFFATLGRRWWLTVPVLLLLVAGVLAAVPYTRFKLAGLVITQPLTVTVTDDATGKPVSQAEVIIDGQTYKTGSKGIVTIAKVKPGDHAVKLTKKYYKDGSLSAFVPINGKASYSVKITATGRQVAISVTNKLTGKPLENVTLKAAGSEVKTDKEGKATIVLPVEKPQLNATLSNGGFNTLETKVTVTDQIVKENSFALVPTGKLYFLSRQSGKIDVVKTDLDGGNRQTIVNGTGKEESGNTVLLASRDWKFLAFYSKRDSGVPRLYLIDTSSDKMSEMDSGNATFQLIGWSGHNFAYSVTRNAVKEWEANRQAVKSYDAEKRQIITIDQTAVVNGQPNTQDYQVFDNFNLLGDKLLYSIGWFNYAPTYYSGVQVSKSAILRQATVGTTTKKDIKVFEPKFTNVSSSVSYEPNAVYFSLFASGGTTYDYFEYEDGEVKAAKIEDQDFFSKPYPTFLASPDGSKTFWSEQRDGRDTFFIGDKAGENGKQVTVQNEFQVYGWYGDDYLLMSKKGSELYILPVSAASTDAPFKVADYHKPQYSYRGYGGGYGGL